MRLIELWRESPDQFKEKQLQQLIAFSGNGKLFDGSETSIEFREFINNVPTSLLRKYIEECLTRKFEASGYALQDLINEIGRRLGFTVENGRYKGIKGKNGYDGLWISPEKHHFVVEVKTTDAFRIDLNAIANYRKQYIRANNDLNEEDVSILVVVGRNDTGDLEAQIRGSKHAWDIRLISIDALSRLLKIKESIEDIGIEQKIRSILIPREYTRLDEIIDLVFATTEDIIQGEPLELLGKSDEERESRFTPVDFNDECVERISVNIGVTLIKRSRAIYSSNDNKVAVFCAVSKEYDRGSRSYYWFAFHPQQRERLKQSERAYVSFGCGSAENIILIPLHDFDDWLDGLNQTHRQNGKYYWHVQIFKDDSGSLLLHQKKGFKLIDISKYRLIVSK